MVNWIKICLQDFFSRISHSCKIIPFWKFVMSKHTHLLLFGLLQLQAVRHVRWPFAEGSVHSKCRRTSGHRSSTMRPTTISRRCCIGCLSVNKSSTRLHAWYNTSFWLVRHIIHSRRHPTHYGQWLPSATFGRRQDMPRSTDAQQLRQSKLQCCRPVRVEQFTAAPAMRHELCMFHASTENISIRELSTTVHCDCCFAP